jgi:hypothetical protein
MVRRSQGGYAAAERFDARDFVDQDFNPGK